MSQAYTTKIASEMSLRPRQVEATAELLAGGGTVPFIARYRKEATGSLDETVITAIRDRLEQLKELDARREAILKSLEEHICGPFGLLRTQVSRQRDQGACGEPSVPLVSLGFQSFQ